MRYEYAQRIPQHMRQALPWIDHKLTMKIRTARLVEEAQARTQEEAVRRRKEAIKACGDLRERSHNLAMLSIQSDRYRDDYQFRRAVDAVLAITQPI